MAWFTKKEAPKPRPAPQAKVGAVEGVVELPELSRVLTANERAFMVTCCASNTQGTVTWPELGIVRRVQFYAIDGDQLHLTVTNDLGKPYECKPRTQCVVSFFYSDRAVCCIAYEESKGAGQRPELVVLRLPTQIAVEGRTRFRIPILPKLELSVAVIHEGRRIKVPDAIDISVAGMMVSFPKDRDPGLRAEQVVQFELSMEGASYRVPCTIRNRIVRPADVRYGILFHNGSNGFDYDLDSELNDMIMGIERFYVRNRNR
jgi:hypothetical protein